MNIVFLQYRLEMFDFFEIWCENSLYTLVVSNGLNKLNSFIHTCVYSRMFLSLSEYRLLLVVKINTVLEEQTAGSLNITS